MKTKVLVFLFLLGAWSVFAQSRDTKLVIPVGHTSGISAVDISPNGKYLVTGSLDYTAKIWDGSGREIHTLVGHKNNVLAVAFSPVSAEDPEGGKYILTGSSDYTAILWDQFGTPQQTFKQQTGYVKSVAFSPDGKHILTGSKDKVARLMSRTGPEVLELVHPDEVNSVAFSPKGDFILTACNDKTAVLWSRDGRQKHLFVGHKGAVLCAIFSGSGDTVLTGSADGTAILWKSTGEKIRDFQHSREVQAVAMSPDGKKIATGSSDGSIKIWNLSDKETQALKIYNRGLRALKFTANGELLLSGSEANTAAKIFQLDGQAAKTLKGYTHAITAMALSTDGASMLVGQADSTAKIWDLSGQQVRTLRYPGKLESVSFAPQNAADSVKGKFFLTGCEDRVCRIQDFSGKETNPFTPANRAVYSPDGKWILTGNSDGTTKLWNLETKQAWPLQHAERRVTALAFSPVKNRQAFALGSYDGRVVYWDSLGAKPVTFPLSTASSINSLAFSPDGKYMVFGSEGGLTEIRDQSGKLVKDYPNRKRGVQNIGAVAFSPVSQKEPAGGKYVLRATGNNAELWDLSTNNIAVFSGHTSDLSAAAFSPDGGLLYTASKDGTVKLWDLATGKEIATLISIGAQDWAVTTPSGLYDASPGAMKLMHYVVGMDVVTLRQIKERYWEPGLLAKVAGLNTDPIRNVAEFDSVSMYPEVNMQITGNELKVRLTKRNGGIGKLSLFVNGKRMKADINPDRLPALPPINLDEYNAMLRSDTVNTIGLIAYNEGGWLRSPTYERPYRQAVSARGENTPDAGASASSNCKSTRPNLYLIVVGTSKYQDAAKNLNYPDQDAEEMAKYLSATGKELFGTDHVKLKKFSTIGGETPISSKDNIKAAFLEFAKMTTPCDILVAYFSGHGSTWGIEGEKSSFYYLTKDITSAELTDAAVRKKYAISDADLEAWLTGIRAQKQVLILDACHSGKAAENLGSIGQRDLNPEQVIAMGLLNDRTGTVILTGSAADMVSFEASKFGQGLLTYSLLQGMSGAALKNDMVDVQTLFQYAKDEVPHLAASIKQVQIPQISGEASFPIGIKNDKVTITLPAAKPVFINSNFSLIGYGRDTLGLAQALNDYFYHQKIKGAQAKYVYFKTDALDDAYKVDGYYTINGEMVTVTANLFKGNKPVGDLFEVKADRSTKMIVDLILEQIKPRIPLKK